LCGFANRRSKVEAMTKAEISSQEVQHQAASPTDPVPDPTTGPSVAPEHLGEPLVVLSGLRRRRRGPKVAQMSTIVSPSMASRSALTAQGQI
jgi:hypothetical protein